MSLIKTNLTQRKKREAHSVKLIGALFGTGSLHAFCGTWFGSAWRTLCTNGSGHACMRGAVFTACGRGAVQQLHPLHWASASKPGVPAAPLLCCCWVWSSGRRTAGLQAPCALWFSSTRVRACELKWWESCWLFFSFFLFFFFFF